MAAKRLSFFNLFIFWGISFSVIAQDRIVIQNIKKPDKIKKLKFKKIFGIKTTDTTYFVRVSGFSDSLLFYEKSRKAIKDTTFMNYEMSGKTYHDTFVNYHYVYDTFSIALDSIISIRKNWFGRRDWLQPFGMLLAGAAISPGLIPFIIDDKEALTTLALFDAIAIGVCVPVCLVGNGKTKYDMKHKWRFKPR